MRNYTKQILAFVSVVIIFASCKKGVNDYYKAPDNLASPVYKQLESMGNFTKFLSLIDKAGYKQTLSAAGYWTLFAPTDSAFNNDNEFKAYLQTRGINSIESMDSATALSIVQYLLVYNAFDKNTIDDYQSNLGYIPNAAFKRRTAYYTGFYKDTSFTGQVVTAIASNRNGSYVLADNNNKYIPIFTDNYFSNNGLLPSDYNYFYPNTTFSGFNIANAKVTQQDIAAGNGVVHVIDHVVTPLMSLDQYLRTKPEFSEFRKLIEKFMVSFIQNADATHRYQVLSGSTADVMVKTYSTLLAFSLNNENYFRLQENDAQRDGWTLMAPQNDSLLKYINTVLLENYSSVDVLPINVLADLINSHMWQTTLWPGKFTSTANFLGERLINPVGINSHVSLSNVIDKKILSNGFFYGINKVNEPNVFSTVYGKAYLNPKFSLMTRLLEGDIKTLITNINAKYTVFMFSDAVLRAAGYDYNTATSLWTFNGVGSATNFTDLLRIVNLSVVETPNGELNALGTPGFTGSGAITTVGGEVIKYNGNRIISAGTGDRGLTVTIDSVKTAKNGRVIYINNLLYFSALQIGDHIKALGTPTTSEFNLFWNYLRNSTAYDSSSATIVGTISGNFYTVLVPNNASIRQAITDGLLPGTSTAPKFNPTLASEKALVQNFILYHVLDKITIIPDGKTLGNFPTLYKKPPNNDQTIINVQYPAGVFELKDQAGIRKAHLVTALSNQLSQRAVIHLIDNYLKYP